MQQIAMMCNSKNNLYILGSYIEPSCALTQHILDKYFFFFFFLLFCLDSQPIEDQSQVYLC